MKKEAYKAKKEKAKLNKEAYEAKKAAAELTARLGALEVEAKANKEVIVSLVSLSTTCREASKANCPLCCPQCCWSWVVLLCKRFLHGNRKRGQTFAHQAALSISAVLCRDTNLNSSLLM